jgi:ribosomal protein S13
MKQDEEYIKARDEAKKHVNFSKLLGGSRNATYIKNSGNLFNNKRNPDLTEKDIKAIRNAIGQSFANIKNTIDALNKFKLELKRIENEGKRI